MTIEERVTALETSEGFFKDSLKKLDDIPEKTVERMKAHISGAVAEGIRLHRKNCKVRRLLREQISKPVPLPSPPLPPVQVQTPIDWLAMGKAIGKAIPFATCPSSNSY